MVEADAEIMVEAVFGIAATVTQVAMEVEAPPTEAAGAMDGAEAYSSETCRIQRRRRNSPTGCPIKVCQ